MTDPLASRLRAAKQAVVREISYYPAPIAGCDQQFNHLLEQRDRINAALFKLDAGDLGDGERREIHTLIATLSHQ